MKIKLIIFEVIILITVAKAETLDKNNLISTPDSTVSTVADLSKYGINSLQCDIESLSTDEVDSIFRRNYGGREPYVHYSCNLWRYAMTIYPSDSTIFTYPEITLNYKQTPILKPYYEEMNDAPIFLKNQFIKISNLIRILYGIDSNQASLSLFDFKKNVIKEQGKYFFISNDDSTEIFFVDENSIEIRDAKLIKPELDSMKFAFIKKEPTEYAVELITVFLDP